MFPGFQQGQVLREFESAPVQMPLQSWVRERIGLVQ